MKPPYYTCSILTIILSAATLVIGQNLKADYQFQGNLNSSVAGAPALTNLAGSGGANSFAADTIDGYTRQTLRFPFNSGFSLNVAGLVPASSYTFVGLFRLDNVTGRRRIAGGDPNIIDANDGAYIVDGRLEGEVTSNAAFRQNHYIQLVFVRESNGTVRAYRDGTLRVTASDVNGDFILEPLQRYFQDDNIVPNEASAGNIARFRIYDGPMTTTQVRALDRVANSTGGGTQPILFTTNRDGNNEIYTMNADGSNQHRLTNNELSDASAQWSPNGQKIVYHRTEAAAGSRPQIWIMNSDGSGQTRLTNTTTSDVRASWRPDGQKILFSRCDATGVCDLYTMNSDGSGQTVFPGLTTANDEDSGSYSPDGTKVVFVCSSGGSAFTNQNICTANADGSNRQQTTIGVSPVVISAPMFSPDSTRVVFVRQGTSSVFSSDIFTTNLNGSSPTQLTNDNFPDLSPIWSPDGQRIATSSQREEATFTEIYTMNASNGSSIQRLTTNSIGDSISSWRAQSRTRFDYDGDGRADLSVRRPLDNIWYLLRGTAGYTAMEFGVAGDLMAPADYDGDSKTDVAVFRPSNGTWYIFNSASQSFQTVGWGASGDLPVPADHDGDGRADLVVFRPSTNTWYTRFSLNNTFATVGFGAAGDKPMVGDFDGDGKADVALYRPSDNNWYILKTGFGFFVQTWGQAGDIPVPADYDGDGKTDVAVFRPSTGQWFRIRSTAGFDTIGWGQAGDQPIPADYDGDGKSDVAVFRPSNSTWYIVGSTAGQLIQNYGVSGDVPTQGAFIY